jgi:hypothetical protein
VARRARRARALPSAKHRCCVTWLLQNTSYYAAAARRAAAAPPVWHGAGKRRGGRVVAAAPWPAAVWGCYYCGLEKATRGGVG